MKKMAICLMVACLSLFAYPYELHAGSLAGPKDKTELPIIPPVLEKQINKLRENHPEMFTKKDKREVEKTAKEAKQAGLIGFAISVGVLVLIILLIMMLI